MSFPNVYREIKEMVKGRLTTRLCRAIVRKSGIHAQLSASTGPETLFVPPGGERGQHLVLRRSSKFIGPTSSGNTLVWVDNSFETFAENALDRGSRYDPSRITLPQVGFLSNDNSTSISTSSTTGIPGTQADWTKTPVNTLGIGPRRIIHFGNLRNPPAVPTYYPGPDDYTTTMRPIGDHRARQFFVWEDIPEGRWYYPLNLDFYNKKVDFAASAVMNVEMATRICACVVEGNPNAELVFCYSLESRTGPWIEVGWCDLQPGGAVRSAKHALADEMKADIWVCLMLRARSAISKLHLSYATVTAEWILPTDYWQPYRTWTS